MVSSGFNENRGWWVLRLGHAREPCRVQYNSQDFAEAARNSLFKNCCSFCTLTPLYYLTIMSLEVLFFNVLQRHQILKQLVTTNLFQIISNVIQSLISCFCLWASLVILFSVSMWQHYHISFNFNLLLWVAPDKWPCTEHCTSYNFSDWTWVQGITKLAQVSLQVLVDHLADYSHLDQIICADHE